MNLKTWDGNNINDGSNYTAILNADVYGLEGVMPQISKRQGYHPLIAY